MVVSEGAINNIMGGMENTAGVRLHSHRHKLKQRFDIIRKLGQGTYGKVQLAVNKETGQEVAIKTIKKAKIETEQDLIRIRREIQIMSSVQHPQIIHIYEVFENREKMVLVMEYAAGGELYDYLSERKVLPEEEARRVFRHVASATYYCHKHKICHRDLKLENILLDLEGNAKIADFGLSNVFDDGHRLDTFCGSPLYASPEIVKGIPYTGPEVDCWSLGVLLYTLVYGAMPFDGSNFKRLVKQITQGDYYEPKKPSRASDLIRSMLTVSATKRASVEDICAHWWVNEGYMESCLDIAEALANQTPVRLDLLLSLAPKHINSEHMLIQPEDEDSSMRSPPTSECGRAPPDLQLPPPPPPSDSTQLPVARTSSLSGIYSVNTADLDALFAQKKKAKKEAEKKRKIDDVNSLEKKKKKDAVEGTPKPVRKDHKLESGPNQEIVSSGPKPPSVPVEANSSEKKKIVKKVDENETLDKSEKSDRRKSIIRRDSTVENDTSDKNEQPDRRRSLVKRRESTVEREINDNDKKKIVVNKRESSAGRPSKEDTADRRRSIRAKETPTREIRPSDIPPRELKPVASSAVGSVSEPSSVINIDKSDTEDQTATSTLKPPLPKDQGNKLKPPSNEGKSSRSSSNKSLNGLDSDGAPSMEVVEIIESLVPDTCPEGAQNSASMRSVGSSNEMTLKASDSSLSRESASPMKIDVPIKGKESPKPSASPSQTNVVRKTRSKSLIKNNSKSKVNEVPSVNGDSTKPAAPSEVGKENIPQETTDIKHEMESKIPTSVKTQDSSSKVEESAKESSKSVSDAKKAFEKPTIEKPLLGLRKKSVPDTSSTVPKPQSNLSTPQIAKDRKEKSPSKEKILKKELEKEKSPRKELEKEKSLKKEKEASKSPRRSCTPLRECEKAKKKEAETNRIKEEKVVNREEDKSEEIIPNIKETMAVGGGASSSMNNVEEKVRVGVDDRLVKPKTPTRTVEDTSTKPQRKSKIDIVLNKTEEPKSLNRRSSHAEIKLSSPPPKESPRTKEFKTEIRHSVSSPRSNEGHRMPGETQLRSGDAHLQRAKRERIIPIMLEDTDDEDNTTSEPLARTGSAERSVGGIKSSMSSRVISPQPLSHTALSRASQPTSPRASSPEPIRKSRRERIIPIQVEGCGVVTPSSGPHVEEAAELGTARAHQAFQRNMGARAHSLSRGNNFLLDHSESFSSAGEEDEDEEDDAFQILTAESLFSTLLNRVRSLTRKMNDDPRVTTSRRSSQQPTPEPMMGPGHVGSGPSGSSGFWSSLYSSPRDSPSRRENMSHSSIGRDDETLGGIGSPMWRQSVSRDTSDADTFFSEASTPFGTLPRGWKSRWSGGEDGGDSDTSEASARSQGPRRHPYSRGPSRELHNIPDDEVLRTARGGTGGTFPRPYPTSNSRSDGTQQQRIVPQDSAERVVAMYGTMKRRPKSSMSGLVGEGYGREAVNFEPQPQQHNPPRPHTAAADVGTQDMQQYSRTPQLSPTSYLSDPSEERAETVKQSVHEQLQQLVRELESVPDEPANEAAKILRQLSPSLQQNPPEYNLANRLSKIPTPRSAMSPPPISGRMVNVPSTTSADAIVKPKVINRKTVSPAKECIVTNGNIPTNNIKLSTIGTVQAGVGNTMQSSSVEAVQLIPSSAVLIGIQGTSQSTLQGSEQPGVTLNEQNSIKSKQAANENVGYNAILDISKNGVPSKLGAGDKKEPGVVRTSENVHIQVNKVKGTQDNSGNFPNQSTAIHTLPILDQTSSSSSCSSRPSSGESNVSIANTDVETSSSPSTVTTTPKTNTLPSSSLMPIASTTTASKSNNSNVKIPENSSTFNTIPRVSSNNNSISNTSSVATSSSSTGIPVKSNSRTNVNSRNSFSGSNLSTNSLNRADLLQPKTYRRSKSKELTPAIEAAGEKITQLHSGTLKRISPFEAYRKSKSRELPLSAISNQEKNIKAISPPERAKSPFERAKSSIETKFNRAKSPIMDKAKKVGETIIGEIKPATPILKRAASMTIPQVNDIHINGTDEDSEKGIETDESKEKSKLKKTASCDPEKPKSMYKLLASKFNRSGSNVPETTGTVNSNEKKVEEDENEKDDKFTLKRPSGFLKKAAKSSSRTSLNDTAEDELSDRTDRKPSKKLSDALNKFLGRKDSKEEQSRKSSREDSRSTHTPSPQPTTITDTLATSDIADPSKLPRVKPKKFSMSQEHLNRVDEIVENGLSNGTEQKNNIVAPEEQQSDVTLASVTKSICDHLSQLENDITYRIGNIGTNERNTEFEVLEESNGLNQIKIGGEEGKDGADVTNATAEGITTSTSKSKVALTNTQIPSPVSNYGLSPALANRRSARPTNLDLASAGGDSKKQVQSNLSVLNSPSQRSMIIANNREVTNNSPKPFPLTSPTDEIQNNNVYGTNNNPNTNMNNNNLNKNNDNISKGQIELNENDTVKFARIKRIGGGEGIEDESLTPTESGSTTSGNDEGRSSAMSDQEDESVMDRIMRKSYYSRFQEAKKPAATRKVNTKESIDQQLAAAKTRLMIEDQQKAMRALSPPRRDTMSPSRVTSPMSPRNSVMNQANWSEPNRKPSRKSMPPEEYNQNFGNGNRRSSSIQRDDPPTMRRLTSMPPEEKVKRRFSSVTREDSAPRRINRSSVPRDDVANYRRTTPQREMYPASNNYRSKEDLTDGDGQTQEVVAVAAAVGAAAGVAASIAASERAGSRSRESSLSRLKSPEPQGPRGWTPTRDETLTNAREELSRRIGHLTRFSGTGSSSSSNSSNSSSNANTKARVIRPYGRTSTTQVYPPPPPFTPSGGNNMNPSTRQPDRPAYRRTNTMDLPPSEAQARPGSEYRRMLQDPARRYSATRPFQQMPNKESDAQGGGNAQHSGGHWLRKRNPAHPQAVHNTDPHRDQTHPTVPMAPQTSGLWAQQQRHSLAAPLFTVTEDPNAQFTSIQDISSPNTSARVVSPDSFPKFQAKPRVMSPKSTLVSPRGWKKPQDSIDETK